MAKIYGRYASKSKAKAQNAFPIQPSQGSSRRRRSPCWLNIMMLMMMTVPSLTLTPKTIRGGGGTDVDGML